MPEGLVYIADDEPDMTDLISETLTDAGYEVVASHDGTTLLDRVRERRPDLVLLDINMPGLSGWEVRRHLAQDPETAHIPVIAVTAQGGAAVQESATRTLEFAGLIRKPFRLVDLLDTIDQVISAQKTA